MPGNSLCHVYFSSFSYPRIDKNHISTFPVFQRVRWRPGVEIEGVLIPLKDETVEQLVKKFFGTFVTDLRLVGALYYLTKTLGMQRRKLRLTDQHMCTATIKFLPISNGVNGLCHAASTCRSTISCTTPQPRPISAYPAAFPNQPG